MARPERRYGPGITLGGIIVIAGIILMFVWSFWLGLIIGLVGLVFFGGFARGRWYQPGEDARLVLPTLEARLAG